MLAREERGDAELYILSSNIAMLISEPGGWIWLPNKLPGFSVKDCYKWLCDTCVVHLGQLEENGSTIEASLT